MFTVRKYIQEFSSIAKRGTHYILQVLELAMQTDPPLWHSWGGGEVLGFVGARMCHARSHSPYGAFWIARMAPKGRVCLHGSFRHLQNLVFCPGYATANITILC